MTHKTFKDLLAQVRAVHAAHQGLQDFCDFPNDLQPQPMTPFHAPCADHMAQETRFATSDYAALRDAFVRAGPHARWRETYKDTDIGDDFMKRFGCYCLIGPGGAYSSAKIAAYVVTMPADLHYTWHHHPAEELYFVVAGQATFFREGMPEATLGPGQTSFHASNQPHAMETRDHPVMAMVLWRNGFDTPPQLTERPVKH